MLSLLCLHFLLNSLEPQSPDKYEALESFESERISSGDESSSSSLSTSNYSDTDAESAPSDIEVETSEK